MSARIWATFVNQSQEGTPTCCEPGEAMEFAKAMTDGDSISEKEKPVGCEGLPGIGEYQTTQKEEVKSKASASNRQPGSGGDRKEEVLMPYVDTVSSKDTIPNIENSTDEMVGNETCTAKPPTDEGKTKRPVMPTSHGGRANREVTQTPIAADKVNCKGLCSGNSLSIQARSQHATSKQVQTVARGNASRGHSGVVDEKQARLLAGQSKELEQGPGNQSTYTCEDCSKVCTSAKQLNRHRAAHSKPKASYACDVCDKTFLMKVHLKRHKNIHMNNKPHMCKYCGQTFTQVTTLAQHERLHTGERPYVCSICSKSYIQQSGLNYHMRSHTGEKPFLCSECGRAYASQAAMTYHCQTAHESKSRQGASRPHATTKCPTCGKLVRKSELRRHLRRHETNKPHKCPECNKGFAEKGLMKIHARAHYNIRPYSCNFCDKTFTRLSNQREHERTHTGAKPYKCKFCDKSFAQISTLRRHGRLHTGEKPFKCMHCGKTFRQPSGLNGHLKSCTKPTSAGTLDVEEVAREETEIAEAEEGSVVLLLPPGLAVVKVVTETHSG